MTFRGHHIRFDKQATPSPPVIPLTQFYVSQAGGGTGLTVGSPCKVASVWALVTPVASTGPVVNFADGTYTGATSMIAPPAGLSGVAGLPIQLKVTNEGQVTIDGQGVRNCCQILNTSAWFEITGFNVTGSLTNGMTIGTSPNGASNISVRRCVVWDNSENGTANSHGIAVNYGTNNLIEDCATFGGARKGMVTFSNAGPNTFRRCWGEWNYSITEGPKQGMSYTYYSYNTIMENCIFGFNAQYLPDPYTVCNTSGDPLAGFSPVGGGCTPQGPGLPDGVVQADTTCQISNRRVQNTYSAIAHDNPSGTSLMNISLLGSIAYGVAPSPSATIPAYLWLSTNLDNVTIRDACCVYPNTATFAGKRTFNLANGPLLTGNTLTNATSFMGQGTGSAFGSSWTRTNYQQATTPAALYSGLGPDGTHVESLYNTSRGAQIRYRYVNGVLTSTALWPWPMNQRIIDAMTPTIYTPVDVNTLIQGFFGAFI